MGITGGIGSGKTAVTQILKKEWNATVIDADELARRAVEPGSQGLKSIKAAFGDDVVKEDGSLDRNALGAVVFQDENQRQLLNSIVHPIVAQLFAEEVEAARNAGASWVVYDCPLLIEENLLHLVDQAWLVRAPEKKRIERIVARNGISPQEAQARMAAQMKDEEKEPYVRVILWNDGSLESLKQVVLELWEKYFKILLSIE